MRDLFDCFYVDAIVSIVMVGSIAVGAACEITTFLFGMFIGIHDADNLMIVAMFSVLVALIAFVCKWRGSCAELGQI